MRALKWTMVLGFCAALAGCGGGGSDEFVPTEPPRTVVIGHPSSHLLGAELGNSNLADAIFTQLKDGPWGLVSPQKAQSITVKQLLTALVPNTQMSNNLSWLAPGPSNNFVGGLGGDLKDTVFSQLDNGEIYLSELAITNVTYQCMQWFFGSFYPRLAIDLNVYQRTPGAERKFVLTLDIGDANGTVFCTQNPLGIPM